MTWASGCSSSCRIIRTSLLAKKIDYGRIYVKLFYRLASGEETRRFVQAALYKINKMTRPIAQVKKQSDLPVNLLTIRSGFAYSFHISSPAFLCRLPVLVNLIFWQFFYYFQISPSLYTSASRKVARTFFNRVSSHTEFTLMFYPQRYTYRFFFQSNDRSGENPSVICLTPPIRFFTTSMRPTRSRSNAT